MAVRAILFDLDGTLVDTLEDITRGLNAALASLKEEVRTADEVRFMVGLGVEELCRRALRDPAPERVERLAGLVRENYAKNPLETAAPYQGIKELLLHLQSRRIRMAVLSNKPEAAVQGIVGKLFKPGQFDVVLGHREGLPLKPDPTGAQQIARELGVRPADFIYVGDSEVDARTAAAAQMPFVGVTWGFRTPADLLAAGTRALVHRPQEIVGLVRERMRS